MSVVYDAGVLIAADQDQRAIWADHRTRLERGVVPVTTVPVVAQASRSPRQVSLRRLLRGCQIVPFAADDGHVVGAPLARARDSDVVDAHVVIVAERTDSSIITADPREFRRLSAQLDSPVVIVPI